MVHNGPGQQLNNRIPFLFRESEGEAKQDVLFHQGACTQGSWERDLSFFRVSQSQRRAQRELVVSLSQGAPCSHGISQHFQPCLTCSGSELMEAELPQGSSL